jgi:hypothetical protein
MKWTRAILVAALLAATLGTGLLLPFTAKASENGRKNTTAALGAVTGYFLYKHQWVPAAVAGAGTYIAYHNWQAAINARHRRERLAYRYRLARYRARHHRTRHVARRRR